MKKISVVVPVYNVEKYLETCLNSIINQSYKNLEIIVVNDGSTDNSLEICKKYQKLDNRIILIDQKNKGLSAARNVGILKATGDYIHFIDSDDFITLNYYEKMLEALSDTDADIVVGGFYYEKYKESSIKYDSVYCYTGMEDKFIKSQLYFKRFVWRYLIKRSLLKDNNILFTEGRYFEDWDFTIHVTILANKIITAPGTEYFYRKNQDGIMLSRDSLKSKKRKEDKKYMKKLMKGLLEKYSISLPEKVLLSKFRYYFLFIPFLTKCIYFGRLTRIKYYLFGIRLFTRR